MAERRRATRKKARPHQPRLPFEPVSAPLIEEQILTHFVREEEERCLEAEAKLRAEGKTGEAAQVKRRKVSKPWTRRGAGLCPPEFLEFVTAFDYELEAPGFEEYCRRRGVAHVIGDGQRRALMADHQRSRTAFMRAPYFRSAQRVDGKKPYRFTDAEMETHWRIVLLGRAALQDCWELFRARREA